VLSPQKRYFTPTTGSVIQALQCSLIQVLTVASEPLRVLECGSGTGMRFMDTNVLIESNLNVTLLADNLRRSILFHDDVQRAFNYATPLRMVVHNFFTNAGMWIPMSFVDVNVHLHGNFLQKAAETIFARLKTDTSLQLTECVSCWIGVSRDMVRRW